MAVEILKFNKVGLLAPKDFELTIAELRESLLVNGPDGSDTWDGAWRRQLVDNLEIVAGQLVKAGIVDIFVDGSFVEEKDHPGDIDLYFPIARPLLPAKIDQLNAIAGERIWGWTPAYLKPNPDEGGKPHTLLWHKYRVDAHAHYGQSTGIRDQFGNLMMFPSLFRRRRSDDRRKGIIKLRINI